MELGTIWNMVERILPKELKKHLEGIDVKNILTIVKKPGVTKNELATAFAPALRKVEPAIVAALQFLEADAGQRCYMVLALGETQNGDPIPVISIYKEGEAEPIREMPFYQSLHVIADILTEQEQQNTTGQTIKLLSEPPTD